MIYYSIKMGFFGFILVFFFEISFFEFVFEVFNIFALFIFFKFWRKKSDLDFFYTKIWHFLQNFFKAKNVFCYTKVFYTKISCKNFSVKN